MVQESVITDEIRKAIGVESEPAVFEVEKGAIRKFAQAIEDPNPLWQDEEYAKRSRFGGIIAPPTFLGSLMHRKFLDWTAELDCPLKRILNAGTEIEYFQPIRPGDVITVTGKLTGVEEKTGKEGKMLIMFMETTYKNQRGEIVAKMRPTGIKR